MQKEAAVPVLQQIGASPYLKTDKTSQDQIGLLGPDGLPNEEGFAYKTIPQGAATWGTFITLQL